MREKTVEWNLGFARDDVIVGLKKLLREARYTYIHTETNAETGFQVTFPEGSLQLSVLPLPSHNSPFNPHVFFRRTLLVMTFTGAGVQDEEAFMRRLTLTFLRAGG
jgi:hypothetical protein